MTLAASLQNIAVVTAFIDEQLEAPDGSMKAQTQIDIAIDELFGNIAHYAYPDGEGDATVRFDFDEAIRMASIAFIDSGVPAALFMMVARALIKAHLQNGESPAKALQNANEQLCEGNEAELFVTVWAAVLEISTGKGVAANAGHEHPALRRVNGGYELQIYRHSPAVATMEVMRFTWR